MDAKTVADVVNRSAWVRPNRAALVGLVLVTGGFAVFGFVDDLCSRSDRAAECSWAAILVPLALVAIFGCTFVMARVSSRARWGARGALALPFLLLAMDSVQELIDHLVPGSPLIPHFPSLAAIIVGVGAAAALTTPSAGLGIRMTHLATTLAFSGVPTIFCTVWLGAGSLVTPLVAGVGVAIGLALPSRQPRRPVERSGSS